MNVTVDTVLPQGSRKPVVAASMVILVVCAVWLIRESNRARNETPVGMRVVYGSVFETAGNWSIEFPSMGGAGVSSNGRSPKGVIRVQVLIGWESACRWPILTRLTEQYVSSTSRSVRLYSQEHLFLSSDGPLRMGISDELYLVSFEGSPEYRNEIDAARYQKTSSRAIPRSTKLFIAGFTAAILAIAGAITLLASWVRRAIFRARVARGRCPACTYPMDRMPRCPECGWSGQA